MFFPRIFLERREVDVSQRLDLVAQRRHLVAKCSEIDKGIVRIRLPFQGQLEFLPRPRRQVLGLGPQVLELQLVFMQVPERVVVQAALVPDGQLDPVAFSADCCSLLFRGGLDSEKRAELTLQRIQRGLMFGHVCLGPGDRFPRGDGIGLVTGDGDVQFVRLELGAIQGASGVFQLVAGPDDRYPEISCCGGPIIPFPFEGFQSGGRSSVAAFHPGLLVRERFQPRNAPFYFGTEGRRFGFDGRDFFTVAGDDVRGSFLLKFHLGDPHLDPVHLLFDCLHGVVQCLQVDRVVLPLDGLAFSFELFKRLLQLPHFRLEVGHLSALADHASFVVPPAAAARKPGAGFELAVKGHAPHPGHEGGDATRCLLRFHDENPVEQEAEERRHVFVKGGK